MSEVWYTPLYCGLGNVVDDKGIPSFTPMTLQLNFEHFARSMLNSVQCGGPDGIPTGVQSNSTIVERHGSFGYVRFDITSGQKARWAGAHPQGPLARIEMIASPTLDQARIDTETLRTQIKTFLDKAHVPTAPTERERAINFLASLNLNNVHPGFAVVRDCYIEALQDVAGTGIHHWAWRAPFFKPLPPPSWPVDADVLRAMVAQLDAVGPTSQRRVMQYAFMYGGLSMVLDSPVT